jgi:hypothetical protein
MLVVAAWATKTGPRVHGIASGQRGPPPGQVTQLTNGATVTGAGSVVKLRATTPGTLATLEFRMKVAAVLPQQRCWRLR